MLNKKGKILIALLLIVINSICLYLLYNIIQTLKYGSLNPPEVAIVSDIKASSDYKVYLNENKFIEKDFLQYDFSYIALLVKYIETNFKYEYKTNEDIIIKYQYELTANVISKFLSDSNLKVNHPIWNKQIVLKSLETTNTTNGMFQINEPIDIDLAYYNNLVNEFRQDLNIPIESELVLKFVVKMEERTASNFVNAKEHFMVMNIPLGVKSFDITTSKNFNDSEIVYLDNETTSKETKYAYVIVHIIIMIIVIAGGTNLIFKIINMKKTKYNLEIEKILNNYNNRIVIVTNFLDYSKFEIVHLKNFEEMLNLADETFEPIIYWEKQKNQEAWFLILRNNILYLYVILNK